MTGSFVQKKNNIHNHSIQKLDRFYIIPNVVK